MNDRGKLSFKENENIKDDKELKKIKKHWESFADSEESERDKYLRELEIQFSMNSFVEGATTADAAKGAVASMLVEKKTEAPVEEPRKKLKK